MPQFGNRRSASGFALVGALFVVLMVSGLIVAGLDHTGALQRSATYEGANPTHARAVATAGVVDAYAWFRRQNVQPVVSFAPARDLTADPPVNETDDPTVGLVREYEVAPNLWARYEVRLTRAAEPYVDANSNGRYDLGETFSDQDANGRWDDARGTRDVTEERGLSGGGAVWLLESHGFLFSRPRADLPLGESPNDRIAGSAVASEIRRLGLTPPAGAAICADTGGVVTVATRGRVTGGGGAGIAYQSGTGSPILGSGSEVTGSPSNSAIPGADTSIEAVFGVGLAELKSMADLSTSDPDAVPAPLGEYTLTVVDGDAVFDATRPLRGTGIMVILGDCTLATSSNSFFNGLLWVGGSLTVRAPCYLRGTVIANGSVDVRGIGGDYAEINYDDGILGELLRLMGQYRHSKTVYALGEDAAVAIAEGN